MAEEQAIAELLIYPTKLKAKIYEGGTAATKILDPQAFTNSLANNAVLTTSILPRGTRTYLKRGGEEVFFIEIPSQLRKMTYGYDGRPMREEFVLPMMPCLLVVRCAVRVGQFSTIQGTQFFALSGSVRTPEDPLYAWPFTNTDYSGGRVCWGDIHNVGGSEATPIRLEALGEMFLGSIFNNHLEQNARRNAYKGATSTIECWRAMAVDKLTDFPYQILKPEPNWKTYGALLDHYQRGGAN